MKTSYFGFQDVGTPRKVVSSACYIIIIIISSIGLLSAAIPVLD